MIKRITLTFRKQGLSIEEFVRHYKEVHAPLVKQIPAIRKYVQNYVITPPGVEKYVINPPGVKGPDFDIVNEIWFEDMEGLKALDDALGGITLREGYRSKLGKIIREDEEKFMNNSRRISLFVEEVVSK